RRTRRAAVAGGACERGARASLLLLLGDRPAQVAEQLLHVLPHVLLLLRAAVRQEERGVIGTQYGNAAVVVELAAQLAQGERRGGQMRRRRAAEAADELRAHQVELAFEELAAVRRLLRTRRAVAGRPAFENIRDEHFFAFHSHGGDDAVEQLPGGTDERL